MSELTLPCFRDVELEFLHEYRQTLAPIAVALDRLQKEDKCYYAELLPTLHAVNNQLQTLQSVSFRHCVPLLRAVISGFQRRFANFLSLTPDVNMAVMATMTHPYFKLRWLPPTLCGERDRLQSLFISFAKTVSCPATDPDSAFVNRSDDTDDDYFEFTQ